MYRIWPAAVPCVSDVSELLPRRAAPCVSDVREELPRMADGYAAPLTKGDGVRPGGPWSHAGACACGCGPRVSACAHGPESSPAPGAPAIAPPPGDFPWP